MAWDRSSVWKTRGPRIKWPLARTVDWGSVPLSLQFSVRGAVDYWLTMSGRDGKGSVRGDKSMFGGDRSGMVSIDPAVAFTIWPRGPIAWPYALDFHSDTFDHEITEEPFYDPSEDWAEFSEWRGGVPRPRKTRYHSSFVRPFPRYVGPGGGQEKDLEPGPYPGVGHSPVFPYDEGLREHLNLTPQQMVDRWGTRGSSQAGRITQWREAQMNKIYDGMERYIASIIGKHMRGMRKLAKLGSGTFATAFMAFRDDWNSGKVLKITSDSVDIVACHRIAGVRLKNVVYVKKSGIIPGLRFWNQWYGQYLGFMGFMVVQELMPIEQAPLWADLGWSQNRVGNHLMFSASGSGTKRAAEGIISKIYAEVKIAKKKAEGLWAEGEFNHTFRLREAIKMNLDIAHGMEQLIPYKVYATDLHQENVGYDPVSKQYKLMDIGLSLSDEIDTEREPGGGSLHELVLGEGKKVFLENQRESAWLKATRQIERGMI